MNILHITPYYSPLSFGGIESQVKALFQATPKKHKCVIIAPSLLRDNLSFEGRVKVYRTRKINPHFKEYAELKKDYEYFKKVIKKERINRIIAHNLHTWINPLTTRALFKVAKEERIPIFLRVHNYCENKDSRLLRSSFWKKYLCVSKSVANQIIFLGVNKKKVKILYPPIDTRFFCPKKENSLRKKLKIKKRDVVIVQASRIVGGKKSFKEKGIIPLLRVFSKIKNKNSHLIISAAKTVKYRQKEFKLAIKKINNISKELGILNRVHLTSTKYENMPKIYNNSDIFIMLSEIETFGGVYAEAMACGLSVIGTNIGGIPEVIKNKRSGFIVSSEKQALVRLEQLIKDAYLREKLAKFGRKFVIKNFDLSKIGKELINIIS
jgi:glycosyltransferase involved in cell wall biosynthesis